MKTILLVPLAITALCMGPSGLCETHYVSPEGSDQAPYLTPETAARRIQSALDAASPGDTVSVAPGEYYENILMGPGLRLLGSGEDDTRIWGGIRAGVDAEIRGLALCQECSEEDPAYAWSAVTGPDTGGLIVAECRISGTYEKGIKCWANGGYVLIVDSEIRGIRAQRLAEAISVWARSGGRPLVCVIDGCVLEDNATGLAAASDGVFVLGTELRGNGTAVAVYDATTILACSFDGNAYGVSVQGPGPAVIESSALTRNSQWGLWCGDVSEVGLVNCTIAANRRGVGLMYSEPHTHSAQSCIIWGNQDDIVLEGTEPGWNTLVAKYCNIGGGWEGNENIDADPLFLDPEAGNFRLRRDSPCIDTGSGEHYYASQLHMAYDLDGKRRFVYGGKDFEVDMGAYEYHINRVCHGPLPGETTLTWSCTFEETYSVFYSDDLLTWHLADDSIGPSWDEVLLSWTDDGSNTGLPPSLAPRRFYRILENP
jgi:hypothetical protein